MSNEAAERIEIGYGVWVTRDMLENGAAERYLRKLLRVCSDVKRACPSAAFGGIVKSERLEDGSPQFTIYGTVIKSEFETFTAAK